MLSVESDKYILSREIKESRINGDLDKAVILCEQASIQHPEENFFYMILGDLYFQNQNFEAAVKTYLEYLKRINNKVASNNFLKRYFRMKTVLSPEQIANFQLEALKFLSETNLDIMMEIHEVIQSDYGYIEINDDIQKINSILSKKSFNFPEFVDFLSKIEALNKNKVVYLLDKVIIGKERNIKTLAADKYSISVYEKLGEYEKSILIAASVLEIQKDPVVIRTLFRICRKLGNYSAADTFLSKHTDVLKMNDFNILYELVYYFESQNDQEQINNILLRMEKNGIESTPIKKTLINFYLKFGMLDRANILRGEIRSFNNKKANENETRFSHVVKESEEGIWSKIQELYSELDHQKQLAAISELTTGISHELGQPITNIRYTIQFYREMMKRKIDLDTIIKVFDSILEETERMGNLVKRLSPLTSSKSLVQEFSVLQLIQKRVNAEEARLKKEKIKVNISSNSDVLLVFDPVKFEQIISNLLLNSIYSIKECYGKSDRVINFKISEGIDRVTLNIEDTGKGVAFDVRRKIFEPFFSTKPPGEGEGLGLFIIWNILKMQGGTITLDPSYTLGARFIINIPR